MNSITSISQPELSSLGLPRSIQTSVLGGPFEGEAVVQGDIPSWLCGQLIRTAPAIFELNQWRAEHWFDALGMLYSFTIDEQGDVRWMQRLLECEFNQGILNGRDDLASFGTPNRRSFLQRLLHPVAHSTDNSNVNIRSEGKQWIAMTETQRQLSIHPDSLKTESELVFNDALPQKLLTGAHPHQDVAVQELINIGMSYGARSCLIVFSEAFGSHKRKEIGRVPLVRAPYVHSFSVTATKIVLILPPYDLKPVDLLWSKRPIAEHYQWSKDSKTRVIVMDRLSGQYSEHWGPAFFFFHTVNAFDANNGTINLELLASDDANVISKEMTMSSIRHNGLPNLKPTLRRITISPNKTGFDMQVVAPEAGFEFPTINYDRVNGRPHRYIWGSDLSQLIKIDTATDTVYRRSLDGISFGEPVFVERPGAIEEDDGVLLTVGSCDNKQESELTIWDARTLDVLARAFAPICIPMGFHGSFEMK